MSNAMLATELALPRYSEMSHAEAAADLNTPRIDKLVALTMQELREWAGVDARGDKIRIASTEHTDAQVRNLAFIAVTLLGTDDGSLDPGKAEHLTMVNELVTASVISAADRTALATKATRQITRAAELEIGTVTAGDVQRARG